MVRLSVFILVKTREKVYNREVIRASLTGAFSGRLTMKDGFIPVACGAPKLRQLCSTLETLTDLDRVVECALGYGDTGEYGRQAGPAEG